MAHNKHFLIKVDKDQDIGCHQFTNRNDGTSNNILLVHRTKTKLVVQNNMSHKCGPLIYRRVKEDRRGEIRGAM